MTSLLLENSEISIKNFGTLSPYVLASHRAFNVVSGQINHAPKFCSVRFHPHFEFKRLIAERRKKFLNLKRSKKKS